MLGIGVRGATVSYGRYGQTLKGGHGAIPWTPANIVTELWLDAADASTITSVNSTILREEHFEGGTLGPIGLAPNGTEYESVINSDIVANTPSVGGAAEGTDPTGQHGFVRSTDGFMQLVDPLLLATGYTSVTIDYKVNINFSRSAAFYLDYSADGTFGDSVTFKTYDSTVMSLGKWYGLEQETLVDGVGGIVFTDTAKIRFRSGGYGNNTYIRFDDIVISSEVDLVVSQWDDKSGNDNHATQGTSIKQPITNSRTLNGLNVIDFDGTDDDLSLVAGPQADSAQTIMIAVADFDSPLNASGQRLLNFTDTLVVHPYSSSTRWSLRLEDEEHAQYINASSFTGPLEPVTAGARLISGYRDGTTVGTGVDAVYSTDLSGANYTVNSWKIGSYNSTSEFLNAGFAEVVVLKSYSVDTLQKLEGYLAWKWGLEANLPVSHPYKTFAP